MSTPVFSLDVRRARKGDCLLLHYGTREKPGLAVIDGDPSDVYKPYLRPRLEAIRQARRLAPDKPLPVDLLMVSHIDDDHIKGILELTAELVTANRLNAPAFVKLQNVWHNSFDDILGNDPHKLLTSFTAAYGAASLAGEIEIPGADEHAVLILASVAQGQRLRDDIKVLSKAKGTPSLNKEFNGGLVMAQKAGVDMKKGLRFSVVGPLKSDLAALQKEHDKFVASKKKATPAALAAYADDSVANLSSIVVLAESGGKRMLLTGDARGDKILTGLEESGLIPTGGTLHLNLLKVPHHGSDRNVELDFFKRLTADHYVLSGDGEHGNPERGTLEMILNARGTQPNYTIHLTYPVEEIDKERRAETLKKKKTWSAPRHSLQSLFQSNPDFAKKVSIVGENGPYLIELLGKVGA